MDQVSRETGIRKSLIADLENDDKNRDVGYQKIAILAEHYGVSANWLLGLTHDPHMVPCTLDALGLSEKSAATILNYQETSMGQYFCKFIDDMIEAATLGDVLANYMQLYQSGKTACAASRNRYDLWTAAEIQNFLDGAGMIALNAKDYKRFCINNLLDSIRISLSQIYGNHDDQE